VLGGKPWLAVDVILLGSVPLAGISAFLAVRRVTRSTLVRVWAAASYALLPVAMGAIAAGRIGTAVVFVLIPAIALLGGRMLTLPPRRARRAAWATGLTIAVAAAFVPLVWVVALVAALALVAARPGMWRNLGIVAAVPPVLLLPWTVQVATNPATLLLEVGLQQPGLAVHDLSARSLLLLSPGGPGLPRVWVTAGIAVAALAALLLSRRRALMMAGWSIALAGLLFAVAVSRVVVTPGSGQSAVPAWPGVAMLIAAVGLLLAGATAGEDIPRLVNGPGNEDIDDWPGSNGKRRFRRGGRNGGEPAGRRGPRTLRGIGVAVLALVACSAPVLAGVSWVISGVRGPVGPVSGPVVPAVVSASASDGLQQRALVLRQAGTAVSFSLQRGASPSLGDADLTPDPAAQQALSTAVAALVAPNGGEAVNQGQLLAQLGIGFVLLPTPVNQDLARLLNGVAGLQQVSSTSAFALWRVTDPAARVRVVEPNGTVVTVRSGELGVSGAQVPAAGGTLELAEPAGGWHATLNGRPLTPVASPAGSWAAAFRLPAGGGVLDIKRDQIGRDIILIFELLAVAVVAGLALPGSRGTAEESAPGGVGSRARSGRAKGASEGGLGRAPGAAVPSLAGGPPQSEAAAEPEVAGEPGVPAGRRSHGRVSARGGRAGPRRDRDAAPRQRRGRRPAAEKPAGRSARRQAAGSVPGADLAAPGAGAPAGGPSRRRAPWPEAEPAARGAGWAPDEDPNAGWAADEQAGAGWADEHGGPGWADEHAGSGWSADEPADHQWPAGAQAGQGAGWPEDQQAGWPSDDVASPGAGWPAGQAAGWPEGGPDGWPSDQPASPDAGWQPAHPAGWPANERSEPAGGQPQVAAPRSPSGTWPPPDQADRWSSDPGWSAQDPSGWPGGRSDVLDPLPPSRGSRHRRPEPDDDEGTPGWPIPERDWRGDSR
jgi:hypothetical protein